MKTARVSFNIFIASLWMITACSDSDLPASQEVNIERYMGKWFEIAALPAGIKKGCNCTAFEYKLSDNREYVMVINSCIKKGKQGAVLAKAFVDENSAGAKWQIQFFWPFRKDYTILAVDSTYTYAMAGRADRKSLWIMSRSPVMDTLLYKSFLLQAQSVGFDTTQLVRTVHDCTTGGF